MNKYAKYQKEVEQELKRIERIIKPPKWKAENYIGGGDSKLEYLDLKIPLVRARFKRGFSFSTLPIDEQWKIWNYIWHNSNIFEVMLGASYFAASRPIPELVEKHKIVFSWLERVDNWAHSDELSSHISKILEHDHKKFLPLFAKWNASSKPWYKRASLVGLLFYSRMRKKYLPVSTILKFVDRHIEDEHYYVQKAVGWALREAWNVYPEKTFAYLKKNAKRIPSGGWTAATEKLSARAKKELIETRRQVY